MDISPITNYSSSMSRQPLYDVFLSSRGSDTRRDFADCLYTMLIDAGIRVLRDEEELERGKEIHPELIGVIVQSKISIPVISKDYVSNKSCLMELDQMLKCMDDNDHIIIPIFHYIDPWDVRHCNGSIMRSFREHKKRNINGEAIGSWTSALRRIGQLKGHHLHRNSEVSQGKLIKQLVHQVQRKLKNEDLTVLKQLVGVNPHVQDIMAKLVIDYPEGEPYKIGDPGVTKALGIYGVHGVGKTVLAKYVYSQLYHLFEACSFVENIQAQIKQQSLSFVQAKIISDFQRRNIQNISSSSEGKMFFKYLFRTKRVLVVLDDVDDREQLSALVGDVNCFGPGSRVIVTSQTKSVLENANGAESFYLDMMKHHEALKLFCRHAFGRDCPREKFENLSTEIVAATRGLPLALKVVGSSLFLVKSNKVWNETLTALKAAPDKALQVALERSYTSLDKNEQQIFLDIACFFSGNDKRIPYYMWDDCKYSPSRSMLALHARSLVEIGEDKELFMHETMKNFGRKIVKNENRYEPCKRSRLCDHKEALDVLKRRKGTEKVEALRLNFGDGSKKKIGFQCDEFDGLQNLRFLKLNRANIQGNFGDRLLSLRWLDWQGGVMMYDVQTLNLNLKNLLILDLSWSKVDINWSGWKSFVEARKLKVLNLTGCVWLYALPKFPASMELERLILEDCFMLAYIDLSYGSLKELVSLNMKQCSLGELPDLGPMIGLKELVIDGTSITRIDFREGSMRKLKILSARNCVSLTEVTDSMRYLKSLTYLALDGTSIVTLWESIGSLEKLKTLSLKSCRELVNLPDGIGKLRSLQFLDLSFTTITKLPPSVKHLKAMKVLRMRYTFIQEFPKVILKLVKLEVIDFDNCRSLKRRIHRRIRRLSSLKILNLSNTQISGLPASFSRLSCLQKLDSRCCLHSLPKSPSS